MRYQKYMPDNMQGASNDTKAKILEAATEYFLKTGYKAATTRDIAKAAGVNLGLIPYYFSTKVNLARQESIDLMEHLNQKYFPSLLSMPAPERMYVSSVLVWYLLEQDPDISRFYYEFVESTDAMDTSYNASFISDSWNTIRHYNLNVTEEENSLYLCVMKGTERTLVIRRYRHELDLTREQIVSILVAHYLFDIGVPDEEIARVIHAGEIYCKNFEEQHR